MSSSSNKKNAGWLAYLLVGIVVMGVIAVWTNPAAAAPEEAFFKGKLIQCLVCSTPGGGNDAFARFLVRWLPKFIPGSPRFVIKYMPGAGNIMCRNYSYNEAPDDGTVCHVASTGPNMASLLRWKIVKFDVRKQRPMIGVSGGTLLYTTPQIAKNWDQVYEKEILVSGFQSGMSDQKVIFFLTAKEMLGIKVKKMMFSYGGSGDMRRGYLAGEINFYGSTVVGYPAFDRNLEKSGELAVPMQLGTLDAEGNIIRKDPPVGHVPTVYELYKRRYGTEPSGPAWNVYKTLVACAGTIDKTLLFPPTVDPKIWKIVADACERMIKDPAFRADADKRLPGLTFLAGASLQKVFEDKVVKADPEAMGWLKQLLIDKAGVVE